MPQAVGPKVALEVWGATCRWCGQPAFLVLGPRPGSTEPIDWDRVRGLHGRELRQGDPFICGSCKGGLAQGVRPPEEWRRVWGVLDLGEYGCGNCGMRWHNLQRLTDHDCWVLRATLKEAMAEHLTEAQAGVVEWAAVAYDMNTVTDVLNAIAGVRGASRT